MDKLNFQKAIDTLKNTECTTKEKISKFDQIFQLCLQLQNHSNYKNFLSSAVQILLLFCEDNDSNCRISAEENLNKIIRNAEKSQQIFLVQIDLYHELKKNGNERSLRICLNLFAHFSHLIKHRRRKVYSQNLLPCLMTIAKRKEPLVIESLAEFMKSFAKNLQDCLTEGETLKLVDVFLDNLNVECAIKRRCSAQNVVSMMEKTPKLMKTVISRIQENLCKNSGVLGSLGLLRLLMPLLIESKSHHQKLLELLESCLTFLKTETNHSIVNANLEVLQAMLSLTNLSKEFRELLVDDQKMLHKEMLLSRRSMSVFISSRKSSDTETLKTSYLQIPSASTSIMSTPNKSLTDFSDVEGDSFKSIDFESEISSSPATMKNLIERGAETMSLKSTDSINSFFNSIASNTETVSKFFRKSSTESPVKTNESVDEKSFDLSLGNMPEIADSQSLPETAEMAMEDEVIQVIQTLDDTLELEEQTRELYIGTLFDQSVVEYIVRLVASKFLLEGVPKSLISDTTIRVSIKNLALSVISGCVYLKPAVLTIKLQKDFTDESMMVESLLSYLVDEDLRLAEEEKKPDVAGTSESFLEIKDDHFGECTTATFLDYFSPLSQSLDEQRLISMKNQMYEDKMSSKDREQSVKKINKDLCQLLSKSEIIEAKLPLMETTLKMPEDKDCQFVIEVLMFVTHSDPVLRGNVYQIIGSFLSSVLRENYDFEKFISVNEIVRSDLEFKKLIEFLKKGLKDEIHTVVRQTLISVEDLVNSLMVVMEEDEIKTFLDQLLLVFSNKYWLVQCKYCDVITKINLNLVKNKLGTEEGERFQTSITNQLFDLIKDNDFRVRNHVSELLPDFILNLSNKQKFSKVQPSPPLTSLVDQHLFNFEAFFFDLNDEQPADAEIELRLSKVLYNLSNFLMDITDKNRQFGVIFALKILVRKFNPAIYTKSWKEFNILSVLISFMNKNPGISLDISCQSDMLEVIATLLGAGLGDSVEFMLHLMRILNIYSHLVSNSKPLLVPKQKNKDIFTTSKELAIINSLGFFSSDHFYLKLYLVLKNSYESFKMTINLEAEVKLKQLLHVTQKSLQTLLELKTMKPDHVKMVEETVNYLNQLMPFQPEDCIVTTKILLKFLFQRNFVNRRSDFETVRTQSTSPSEPFFDLFENFLAFEFTCPFESSIKHFDPLVIQGLRMFSKSPAKLQAAILDMLCQLLEFNVNYMQLDAKKVFVDFVMKQLEHIEGGLVIDGHLLAPKIVQFLIYLTKLKDKKIITIPKIINIVDNLLAVSRESGIAGLLVLSIELFFRRIILKGDPEVIEELCKEKNAQREVVISMLLKFLSHDEIQECLNWILVKSRVNPTIAKIIDENEIYVQLVQCIKEEPLKDHRLVSGISKNILLESKNFEAVLEVYLNLMENSEINALPSIATIQEQVFAKTEEVYLTNHIKLYHQKRDSDETESLKKFLKIHETFLLRNLSSESFWKFLAFKRLPTFLETLKTSFDFAKIIQVASSDCSTLRKSIDFVLNLNLDKSLVFDSINLQNQRNQKVLLDIYHKSLFSKRNDINAWENSELMNFFKDNEHLQVLLQFGQNILLDSLLEDPKISRIILKKLPSMKISLNRVKYLLENAHEECLADAVSFVASESSRGNPNSRILQLILVKKFHSMKNEILMGKEKSFLTEFSPKVSELQSFPSFLKAVEDFTIFIKSRTSKKEMEIDTSDLTATIDEQWILNHAKNFISSDKNLANPTQVAQMLLEIKSESKLVTLLAVDDFNLKLLPAMLNMSFERMISLFRVDCVQINPHLNYMKIPPLLKISLLTLMKNLKNSGKELCETLSIFLKWVKKLYQVILIYVEVKFIDKFVSENLLKSSFVESILGFLKRLIEDEVPTDMVLEVIGDIYSEHKIWTEVPQKTSEIFAKLSYNFLIKNLSPSDFISRYQHPPLFDGLPFGNPQHIVFIAKIQEAYEDGEFQQLQISPSVRKSVEKLLEISRNLLRKFYQFAVTPYEILLSYRSGDDLLDSNYNLKQIPIEYLSDSELLERYIRRINRFGFTQRQQFEEIFMTLLVLLNQWNEMQDVDEQFYIKQLCLQTNVELIVSCFRHPVIGCGENFFFHYPRLEKIKLDSVGLKKMHHVQELLSSELNVFYQPNLERIGGTNNLISCSDFGMNQFSLNYSWQMIESREEVASAGSILTRNVAFYQEKCGIDFKSALQMIYDLMTQMIDENHVLVLPQLVKLVDVLDNIEQFRWINKKMLAFYESIASEDTVSHQHVAYLLCRSAAVLVPSLSELQQLQAIINKYLGCNQIFVRNAALHGLLCVFESICKTNTTMGAMSDEMKMLRNCIISYTSKNGIVFESFIKSLTHEKLVWTLNFYVIEMTSKFVTDSDVFIDSIISANNILKRTTDLDLFYLILNGLERLVITNPSNKGFREKIEKLALDLMKVENKLYSIGGLKLLVTCLYSGSLEQLENTEKSNGIVQDEPEILMQSTEKIEMLFTRIRTATIEEAEIYGKVLGQILKDLLPPNEILTKVIKELLIMNQSNCVCVAKIIHQVFRSAIDSSYLTLLQDWLICSLQNFLTYPHSRKSIWFLSLIFLSSTLNQNLLKLFPILLDENLESSELNRIFLLSAKDFYEKLAEQQRGPFKEAFANRVRTRMMSSSICSNASPTNSFAFNNNLFQTFLQSL